MLIDYGIYIARDISVSGRVAGTFALTRSRETRTDLSRKQALCFSLFITISVDDTMFARWWSRRELT